MDDTRLQLKEGNMAKDNNENWKYFEKLAYEYVSHLYRDYFVREQKHTDNSHDSGYDGLWVIWGKDQSCYQKVLMEAKYRTSQSSLPLNDCAKAIIIAFNLNASKLYIATNIAFAPQTREQIAHYNQRSDLTIVCINNNNLKAFIQENKEYLIADCNLGKDFLEEIENSTDKVLAKMIELNFCNDISEEYMQDSLRKKMISDISQGLQSLNACYMLTGNEGVGKSVLANAVKENLLKKSFDVCTIDLSLCTSFRILYLKILETIWGVTLVPILEDEKLCNYIDQLIAVNGEQVDTSISNAVKHILAAQYYEYVGHKDKYLHLLLKYLDLILNIKHQKIRLAIFFENLNMTSPEVLDFLLLLINQLKKNGIRILLEVRTPFLVDHEEISKSVFYFEQLKEQSNRCFSLDVIERSVAASFIQHTSNFSWHVCEHLANFLGDNFLEMQSALQVLEYQHSSLSIDLNHMTDMELEEYWYSCGISVNAVVLSLITKFRTTPLFSSLFEMTHLLKGELSFQILDKVYGGQASECIKQAVESTIFKVAGEKLVCKHLRYLYAMENTSQPYECVNMAKQLLPIIQENRDIIVNYPYIELELLYLLNKRDDIPLSTLNVISLFKDDRQYKKAINTAIRYLDFIKKTDLGFSRDNKWILQILLQALQCIRELHEENEEKYNDLYQMTKKYVLLDNPNITQNKNWYIYRLLIWHKEFISGKFESAYKISKALLDELQQVKILFEKSEDYAGQVYNAHGLSIKMMKGGNSAESFFEEGVKQYPNSYYAKAALLSQVGNRLLKTDPQSACKKYTELLDIIKGKEYPFQEILHTRIDVAMSSFLGKNFEVAIAWSKESASIASSVGIYAQKGRALNILGCCQAAEGLLADSIDTFKESFSLLSLSNAMIYVWRAQLNLASAWLAIGNKEEAFSMIYKVLDILQTFFITKIKADKMSVPYQSLLLILMYLHEEKNDEKIKKIFEQIGEKTIEEDFLQLSKIQNWKEVFHEKVICYNAIVLVTG